MYNIKRKLKYHAVVKAPRTKRQRWQNSYFCCPPGVCDSLEPAWRSPEAQWLKLMLFTNLLSALKLLAYCDSVSLMNNNTVALYKDYFSTSSTRVGGGSQLFGGITFWQSVEKETGGERVISFVWQKACFLKLCRRTFQHSMVLHPPSNPPSFCMPQMCKVLVFI